MFVSTKRSYSEKENNGHETRPAKKIHHSSSILSLKQFKRVKHPHAAESLPCISQPKLNDSSLEKIKNKVRQSPSMMNIKFTGEIELCEEANKRDFEELKEICARFSFHSSLPSYQKKINFMHTDLSTILKTVKIHQILTSINGFCRINAIDLPNSYEGTNSTLTVELPYTGTPLTEFQFRDGRETYDVMKSVIETLALAETQFRFEHRNLHAGNVTILRDEHSNCIKQVTILDCKLSRISYNDELYYTPLDNPDFYEANVPVLFKMQGLVKNPRFFVPETNVLWVKYLTRFILNVFPNQELKKIDDALHSKWPLRRSPRSCAELLTRL